MTRIKTFENGLTVIVEEMPFVESAAFELHIPGGIVTDNEGYEGASLLLAELTSRGAGPFDSRELSDEFEKRGIIHGEGAGSDRFVYRGMFLSEHTEAALRLCSQIVREPRLPEEEVDDIRASLLMDLQSLADNPSRKVTVDLMSRYFPMPYARSGLGTETGLKACTLNTLVEAWTERFTPQGAILSIAGKINADQVFAGAENYFASWRGPKVTLPKFEKCPPLLPGHSPSDSAQLQIALAYPAPLFGDPLFYATKIALGVLSGGMFGRLFIEVREKRGLCYSVFARHAGTNNYGNIVAYAGTTPERAQETLDVMIEVLTNFAGTVSEEELKRSKANLLASLIIGEESSGSRAGSNAADYWLGKRVRSVAEITDAVNAVKISDIEKFAACYSPQTFMLQTLGSKPLVLPTTAPITSVDSKEFAV